MADILTIQEINNINTSIIKFDFNENHKIDKQFEANKFVLIFRILTLTGIRLSELKNLKEENFKINDKSISIDVINKDNKQRTLHMSKAKTLYYFDRYMHFKKKSKYFFTNISNINQTIKDVVEFSNIHKNISTDSFRKMYKNYLSRTKINNQMIPKRVISYLMDEAV